MPELEIDNIENNETESAPMEYVPSERDVEVYSALICREAAMAADNKDVPAEGTEGILYCAALDRTPGGLIAECRIFVLKDSLWVVSYTVQLGRAERITGSRLPARALRRMIGLLPGGRCLPGRRINIISAERIPREGLGAFRIEELPGGIRLVAERDGAGELIARMSLDCRRDGETLVRVLSSLSEDGRMPEQSEVEADPQLCCPRCGAVMKGTPPRCAACARPSSVLHRFMALMNRYRGRMLLIVLFMVISSGLGVLTPYITSGFYIDEVLTEGGTFFGAVGLVLLLSVGTGLLSTLVSVITSLLSSGMSADFIYELKKTVFSSFERLSVSFFTGRQTGGLMRMVDGDAGTVFWLFGEGLPNLLINVVEVAVIFVIMLVISPVLTFLTVIAIPFAILVWRLIFKKMRSYNARRFTADRTLRALMTDIFSGMRVVKTFAKEQEETERFDGVSRAQADADLRASVFSATAFPMSGIILSLSVAVSWGVGGLFVMRGSMSYGEFFTFITYVGMVHAPIQYFYNMISSLSDAINAMSRITDILDAEPDVVESEHPVRISPVRGEVEFRGVGFSYDGVHRVLEDVSFCVPAGKTLGIVGYTGAGKSTIVNLLMRLYDPTAGTILIDGVPLTEVKLSDLRENISIVSQETYLFVGSIYDNIAYAKPEASKAEVIRAAKLAGAHDFIMRMPDAYQTRIGRGNKELSGGERQRISIARALLRDPKILIMDEATAAMDTHTERLIQRAVNSVTRGRTTIIIAHRLSTLRDADSIIVVDEGRIPENGTHEELIDRGGIYAKLYTLQLEALKNIGVEG